MICAWICIIVSIEILLINAVTFSRLCLSLPEATFGPRVFNILSLPASVCVCVRPSVRPTVTMFVRAITHDPFKLGSPHLDQRCKTTWLRSRLHWRWSTLTFKVKFNFKIRFYRIRDAANELISEGAATVLVSVWAFLPDSRCRNWVADLDSRGHFGVWRRSGIDAAIELANALDIELLPRAPQYNAGYFHRGVFLQMSLSDTSMTRMQTTHLIL